MRLCVTLNSGPLEQRVPLSHFDLLHDCLHDLLGEVAPEVATQWKRRSLAPVATTTIPPARNEAAVPPLTFSDLRVPSIRRGVDAEQSELQIGRGTLQWWLASPDNELLKQIATRMAPGMDLTVGDAHFSVNRVAPVALPELLLPSGEMHTVRFTCWTPIVALNSIPGDASSCSFLRPWVHGKQFGAALHDSLLRQYERLRTDRRSAMPELSLSFDQEYLERHPRGGAKRLLVQGRAAQGILAPFLLTGPREMLRQVWECGLGDLTELGFGFVAMSR